MIPTERVAAPSERRLRALPEGPVEWTCKLASEALVVMLVLVAVDIVTRWVFNFSFEVSDEVGGYMLVVICFSLSACHVNGSFHEVEFVQARLTARGSDPQLVFGLCRWRPGLLAWQFARFELLLAVRRYGADLSVDAALAAAACHGARHGRAGVFAVPDADRRGETAAGAHHRGQRTRCRPEAQLLIVTALFLGLLMAGMAVPFAITVPALLYLVLQGGLPALNSLGRAGEA